jgi:acetyl-CoA C-acetyltransferase
MEVVIVSAVRTPIGSFMGKLSSLSAPQLGSTAIKGALEKINLDPNLVDEVYFGNVIQANVGQAPAKQAALGAGIPTSVPCTTVNKVCASGLKAVSMAAQAIKAGDAEVIVVGGMESMSQIPHYLGSGRTGNKLGNQTLIDGLLKDGLLDSFKGCHMGNFADETAEEYTVSREEQDTFALNSYARSAKAWAEGKFNDEIVSVEVPQRKGESIWVNEDEEYKNLKADKVTTLPTAFSKTGTVTAANASTINDGASALILMSKQKAEQLNIKPLAKIVSYADASTIPDRFTVAPVFATEKLLKKVNKTIGEIDFFEVNEAFSVVTLAYAKKLDIDLSKINVNGGAVSLGHPLGSSGSRILVTLINVLKQNKGKLGVAAICNGGGGATVLMIENIE